jgi:hypothetical protein
MQNQIKSCIDECCSINFETAKSRMDAEGGKSVVLPIVVASSNLLSTVFEDRSLNFQAYLTPPMVLGLPSL